MCPARRPAAVPAVLLALLAACASTSPDAEWRALQRHRIEGLHRPRDLDGALARVLARAPAPHAAPDAPPALAIERPGRHGSELRTPQPQDPAKIDERLPPLPGQGPRAFRHDWQPLTVDVAGGFGDVMARAHGSRLGDRTPAWFTRALIETGGGAALEAQYWSSDDDLFGGNFINDGVAPAPADATLSGAELFPHVHFDLGKGALTVPVRIGAFTDWQRLEHQPAGVQREWLGFGPRLVLEPTWRFLSGDAGSLELFTRFGGDLGAAFFSEEFTNGDGRDVALRWGGELGAGLRGRLGDLRAELGYRLQHAHIGELNSALWGDRGYTDLQRQQLFLGFGLRY